VDDDHALWQRVLSGDDAALTVLLTRHQARVFRRAAGILSVREDAKDAVALAFLELWRKKKSVRLVDGSPLPWLLATVTNVALNLERSARRYRSVLQRVEQPALPEESASLDESGVMTALRRLPDRDRHVLVLTVMEGFSERETAAALGVAPGTVKSRLSRAKARLRADIEGLVR
jgi:RNA polymerase sigma factor (sigma-70 family)